MSSHPEANLNPSDLDAAGLDKAIHSQGDHIRHLKTQGATKEQLKLEVERLNLLKEEKVKRDAEKGEEGAEKVPEKEKFDRGALESVLTKRFFYAPAFGIYGGVAGLYDYGPPGCALQSNILSLWRQFFVLEEDMLEVDCTNLTPHDVFKTSGHVDKFADYMCKDTVTGDIFRADHLIKAVLKQRLEDDEAVKRGVKPAKGHKALVALTDAQREEYTRTLDQLDNYTGDDFASVITSLDIRSPEHGNPVTTPQIFNLMFETPIGPTGYIKGYLRPETAQGQFVNFKRLLEFNNDKLPFASASIGRSFRNEISPRAGLMRVREFTMAEIEHFVDPEGGKKHPRFASVRDVMLTLFPGERQMAGTGTIQMTVGEAVDKKIIDNETLGYFVARINLFLLKLGINPTRLRFRQHMANEMAHYACDCWDAEIESSYGWIESVGCADRSAFDLTQHSRRTGEKLVAQVTLAEPIERERWVLETNKPKFGPAFKKNAKAVQGYLDTLLDESDAMVLVVGKEVRKDVERMWNEAKVLELQKKLEEGGGKTTVTGTDGQPYELTTDLVKVFKYAEKINVREFVPNVIEPSFGIGRILYALIEHSWYKRAGDDEARNVLGFPVVTAPFKALVTPISSNPLFSPFVAECATALRQNGLSNKTDESSASIGRRYARADELGTPFAITVDFQTLKDQTVTLRERDSLKQIRESIPTVVQVIRDICDEKMSWADVLTKFPEFTGQVLE